MEKRPKILVVGSYMMDLVASTGRAPKEGETVIGKKFNMAPGGKGNNQAVQCARLGASVTMVGQVGGDAFGQKLLDGAAQAGVDISHVLVDPDEATGIAHITLEVSDHDARNRIIVCPGANFTLTPEKIGWLKDSIGDYDLVMMQLELPVEVVEAVAQWASQAGVPVMLNPAPAAPLSDRLLSCVTYLSPNEHEAAEMAGRSLPTEEGVRDEDLQAVGAYFLEKGVQNVLITLGENGSALINRDGVLRAKSVKVDPVVDTTAAGDSFVAAFCTGLTGGYAPEQALTFASHAAALTVSRMGAMPSLPTRQEVETMMQERKVSL